MNPLSNRSESTYFVPRNLYEDFVLLWNQGVTNKQTLAYRLGLCVHEVDDFIERYRLESGDRKRSSEAVYEQDYTVGYAKLRRH